MNLTKTFVLLLSILKICKSDNQLGLPLCGKDVKLCPVTYNEWKQREEIIDCPGRKRYTCMENVNRTLTEACIFTTTIPANATGCPIFGQCNQEDDYGLSIVPQRNHKLCNTSIEGCPPAVHDSYSTSEIYKYPRCIGDSNKVNIDDEHRESNSKTLIIVSVTILLAIGLIVITVLVVTRLRKRKRNKTPEEDIVGVDECDNGENVPLTTPHEKETQEDDIDRVYTCGGEENVPLTTHEENEKCSAQTLSEDHNHEGQGDSETGIEMPLQADEDLSQCLKLDPKIVLLEKQGSIGEFKPDLELSQDFQLQYCITPAPRAVLLMGFLFELALEVDTIRIQERARERQSRKLARVLVLQIGYKGFECFSTATRNMKDIYHSMSRVGPYMDDIDKYFEMGTLDEISNCVPSILGQVSDIVKVCTKLSSDAENKFKELIEHSENVQKELVTKIGGLNDQSNEVEKTLKKAVEEECCLKKQCDELDEECETLEKRICEGRDSQNELHLVISNAKLVLSLASGSIQSKDILHDEMIRRLDDIIKKAEVVEKKCCSGNGTQQDKKVELFSELENLLCYIIDCFVAQDSTKDGQTEFQTLLKHGATLCRQYNETCKVKADDILEYENMIMSCLGDKRLCFSKIQSMQSLQATSELIKQFSDEKDFELHNASLERAERRNSLVRHRERRDQLERDKKTLETFSECLKKEISTCSDIRQQWSRLKEFFENVSSLLTRKFAPAIEDLQVMSEFTASTTSKPLISKEIFRKHSLQTREYALMLRKIAGVYVQLSENVIKPCLIFLDKILANNTQSVSNNVTELMQELKNVCQQGEEFLQHFFEEAAAKK